MKKVLFTFLLMFIFCGCVEFVETPDTEEQLGAGKQQEGADDFSGVEEKTTLKPDSETSIEGTEIIVGKYMNDFDYEKVSRYPDDYIGKNYEINGKVTQVLTSGWSDMVAIRMNVDGDYKKNLYVEYDKDILSGNILTDDEITIYATFKGMYSYTTVLGSSLTVPKVEAQLIKISIEEEAKEPTEEDIELLGEYYYSDYWYQYRFLVVKNNSDATVEISTSSLAYGKEENIISVGSASVEAIGAGCVSVLRESYDTEEEIEYCETEWSIKKDEYYKSVVQDLSVTQSKIDGGIILQIKNNGEKTASWVKATVLFLHEGKLVDYEESYCIDSDYEIKSGKTASKQINTRKDYDEVKVYLHGRRQ